MSDTPKTDEREHGSEETPWNDWVESAFSRDLERKLAAMTAERDALRERGSALANNVLSPLRPHWSETQMLAQMFLSAMGKGKP